MPTPIAPTSTPVPDVMPTPIAPPSTPVPNTGS
jgi:hypothetical protein